MKLSSVSCRQFAGLRNLKPVEFTDGLNILYGKNESGKSTLVGLIYSLLWQNGKVGSRSMGDKEFRAAYFPAEVRSGSRGSTIDGTLIMDGTDGEYTITKKWSATGSGEMITPTAVLDEQRDAQAFEEQRKALLLYGEGVYREAIFANQKTIDGILQALLKGKLEADLSAVASSAVLDMGGISSERFMEAIDRKMEELENSWDWRTDGPKGGRGIDNKIVRNVGTILKAYYEREETRSRYTALQAKLTAVGTADKAYGEALAASQKADEALAKFNSCYGLLLNYQKTVRLKVDAQRELERRETAAVRWLKAAEQLKRARVLEKELQDAELHRLWEQLEENRRADLRIQEKLKQLETIDPSDVEQAKTMSAKIRRLESQLKNFNALLSFALEDGHELIVTSEADGRRIETADSTVLLTEAVQIQIPGVVTLHLSAADVDVKATANELENAQARLCRLLERYRVDSYESLNQRKAEIAAERDDLERQGVGCRRDRERLLGRQTFDEVQTAHQAMKTLPSRTPAEIQAEISTLTAKPIGVWVGLLEQQLTAYEGELATPEENRAAIDRLREELRQHQQELERAEQIPEEYRAIPDPERRKKVLEQQSREQMTAREERYQSLQNARAAVKAAEEAEDYLPLDELAERLEDNTTTLAQRKEEYRAWSRIKAAAEEILNETGSNPLQALEEDFRRYLALLSGNRVELSTLGKKLNAEIYSGNHRMTYELLSEGTKDTIALAFRLAVLRFLFPEGGGFVVFDDPFTDMDEERRSRACALIQEVARENQVLFVTCDERYLDTLSGNVIRI